MRDVHLWLDRAGHQLVQGLNAANPLGELRLAQGDVVNLHIHNVVANAAQPQLTRYVERPLDFTNIRAAIGTVDAAPRRGTFALRVDGETTTTLEWPESFADAAAIAAWKEEVLDALKALSNVGVDGIRADDPEDTPAHIFYFTWEDEERDDEIEVVSNRLLPWCEPVVTGSLTAVGYTQQLKLIQLPLVMGTSFDRDAPPAISIVETRTGGTGVNAEQTIVVPATAMGSVSFTWDGSATKTIAVAALTAAVIAAALNAIVAGGATNPSFRVESRPDREGKRFAVEFIGPLAATDVDPLTATMHDQEDVLYATGLLNLGGLGIEQALNGATEVELTLELVIFAGSGEETYLREVIVENDMTSAGTEITAGELGAIEVVETEVLVGVEMGESFAEASPGYAYTPPSTASSFAIEHNLGTAWPAVRVMHRTSEGPDVWEQTPDNEYLAVATDVNHVTVSFPFTIATPDLGDWKIYVTSPDATLQLFEHKHIWSEVLESLPSGMSLATKITAIEAAVGMLSGDLTVAAAQITGQLTPEQIDTTALAEFFSTSSAFIDALKTILTTDSTVIATIAEELAESTQFITTLKAIIAASEEIQTAIATALAGSATFVESLETIITSSNTIIESIASELTESAVFISFIDERFIAVLTGAAGGLPAGTQPMLIPAFNRAVPPAREILGGTVSETLGTEVVTATGASGSTVTTRPATTQTRLRVTTYGTLSPSVLAADWQDAGTIDGVLPLTAAVADIYTVDTGGAESLTGTGRRGQTFAAGALITFGAGHWYEVVEIGTNNYYAVENELELAKLHVTENALYAETTFSAVFPLWLKLASDPRARINAAGVLVLEKGTRSGALASIAWAELARVPVVLSDALALTELGITVSLDDGAEYTASVTVNGRETATPTFTSSNFSLRVRLTEVDFEDAPAIPRGSLIAKMTAARAGIAPLTA